MLGTWARAGAPSPTALVAGASHQTTAAEQSRQCPRLSWQCPRPALLAWQCPRQCPPLSWPARVWSCPAPSHPGADRLSHPRQLLLRRTAPTGATTTETTRATTTETPHAAAVQRRVTRRAAGAATMAVAPGGPVLALASKAPWQAVPARIRRPETQLAVQVPAADSSSSAAASSVAVSSATVGFWAARRAPPDAP